jgi:uncharacterized membrane protein (TIGR02234 family)
VSARRELRLAVLLCLLGSAVVLLAAAQTWVTVDEPGRLTIAAVPSLVSGTEVTGLVRPLGIVGLAGVLALAATRSWGRVVVGALLAAAGAGVIVNVALALHRGLATDLAVFSYGPAPPAVHQHRTWAVVTLVGGVLLAAAGLLVALRGRRWVALSSSYEPPTAGQEPPAATEPGSPLTEKGAWDALDRGDDPTA